MGPVEDMGPIMTAAGTQSEDSTLCEGSRSVWFGESKVSTTRMGPVTKVKIQIARLAQHRMPSQSAANAEGNKIFRIISGRLLLALDQVGQKMAHLKMSREEVP